LKEGGGAIGYRPNTALVMFLSQLMMLSPNELLNEGLEFKFLHEEGSVDVVE
jgi:hypothetical protein